MQTTVYRLEAKKAVRRVKKIGNAHIFEAAISRDAAQNRLIDDLLSLFGGRTQPVMSHLIESGRLTLSRCGRGAPRTRTNGKEGETLMTPALHGVLNHLWQSTLFAAAAGLLTLALRRNHAGARHALWLAASAKFLVPFSVLVSLGGRFGWRTASAEAPQITYLVQQIGAPLSTAPGRAVAVPVTASAPDAVPMVLAAVWLAGFLAVAISWFVRWRRVRAVVRAAAPLDPIPGLPIPAPVFTDDGRAWRVRHFPAGAAAARRNSGTAGCGAVPRGDRP